MIQSIGNNFGHTEPINFKDFQSDTIVILNAVLVIDTTKEEYQNAELLEIHVPALSIERSVPTALVLKSTHAKGYGTILRTWIKDASTIAIEKLPDWDAYGPLTLYFATAYVTLQSREDNVSNNDLRSMPTITQGAGQQKARYIRAVTTEHWYYLYINFNKFIGENDEITSPIQCTIEGIPDDARAEIPLISSYGYGYTFGTPVNHCILNGKTLSCPAGRYSFGEGSNEGDFLNVFIVRNQ